MPLERVLSNFWYESDSGDQHSPLVSNNFALKQLCIDASDIDQLGAVTQPFSGVKVSEEHEWHVVLQAQVMRREAIGT